MRVYRTGLIRFWTGHQALKGATTVEPLYRMPGGVLKKTDICCPYVPRLSGQRPKLDVQKALFGRFVEKLSQLIPSFPSRLIKEEIALELAAMTKRLLDATLMFQRAFIALTSCTKHSRFSPTSDSAPWQKSCGGFRSECARGRAKC